MLKRRLGRTNFQASVVGLGGIPIQFEDRDTAIAVVRRAMEMGINYIDTARVYGDSEIKIGAAVKGHRDELFITTKSMRRSREEARRQFEESFQHLDMDYIDLLFAHGVDTEEDLARVLSPEGAVAAFREAQDAGKVRYLGISGHNNPVLVSALKTGIFDVVLASYNLTNTDADNELFPLARELDIGISVMKPLAGGALGVPPEAVQFQVADRAISTAEAALRFVLSNPLVHTVIPGMGSLSELEANVPFGYAPQNMDPREATAHQEKAKELGFTFCQGCGYCLPECPEGINIAEVFRLQTFHDQYGLTNYARDSFRRNRHADKVEQCTACGACMLHCPAQLEIPELLEKAKATLG
ncbi:aldo/keto reductase [Chloroflexota bacterium]